MEKDYRLSALIICGEIAGAALAEAALFGRLRALAVGSPEVIYSAPPEETEVALDTEKKKVFEKGEVLTAPKSEIKQFIELKHEARLEQVYMEIQWINDAFNDIQKICRDVISFFNR